MLGNSLAGSGATLSKHSWKISGLGVDLLFTPCFTHVAFEGMRVNYLLDSCSPIVDHVIGGGEITLLKSVLSSAMTRENVMGHATLAINHGLVVVFELGFSKNHLTVLRGVVVHRS